MYCVLIQVLTKKTKSLPTHGATSITKEIRESKKEDEKIIMAQKSRNLSTIIKYKYTYIYVICNQTDKQTKNKVCMEKMLINQIDLHKKNQSKVLKNDASPIGFGHWFRKLGSLKNIIKNLCL